LKVHDFATTGRGLQTTSDRSAGNVIVKVPEKDALTATFLLNRYPEILGQAAATHIEKYQTKLTDEQVMAVGLLLLKQDDDRYVISLPPQYSVLQMPELFLSFLPLAYKKLIKAYIQHTSDLQVSFQSVLPASADTALLISKDDFTWAFATVRSRCVGMDGTDDDRVRTGGTGEIRVMLPGFDLLNHKFGAKAVPGYSTDEDYVVTSDDAYSKGDQVFISYSDNRNNLKMLMTYGFCIPGNPERVVLFDVQDLLEACAAARPKYFSKPVMGQLWTLMGKLEKQRDMYGFDGQTQQAQESLLSGIDMMADIEKQFISEPDTTFFSDVLAALIFARRAELSKCLDFVGEAAATVDGPWVPIMNSIKVLLEEEREYLQERESIAEEL
jgi:hypothetical protein